MVSLAQGIFDRSFEKMQNILKEQGKTVEAFDKQTQSDFLQHIQVTLLRKFIQHLSAYYEVIGD